MNQRRLSLNDEEAQAEADRQTASLAGVAVTLLLLVLGLFLVRALHAKAQLEDCLLAGRSNCAMVVPSSQLPFGETSSAP